jgi:hypothetical protein
MELVSAEVEPSGPGRVRLVGRVTYQSNRSEPEDYWFEYPERYADSLTLSGNPWLAVLLPLAVHRHEPLHIGLPVDPVLLGNSSRLMEIWSRWYPDLPPVPVRAETYPAEIPDPSAGAAALFSGGVDSFFTILRNEESRDRAAAPRIDRLLSVWGFDVGLETPGEWETLRSHLAESAHQLDKEFVDVATNLKLVRFQDANWGRHAHGCALAAVGLALERELSAIYIAVSLGWARPWGSHPDTDPLLSTSRTRVIHDGVDRDRWQRTEYVSRSAVAMRNLHVCPRGRIGSNCCRCRKCYLVMLTLELLGKLDGSPAFPTRTIDLERVRRIYAEKGVYDGSLGEIERRARAAGRSDIAAAIDECLIRSRRQTRLLRPYDWMNSKRGLCHIAKKWRSVVLAGSVQ